MYPANVYNVMIASPGDVADDREVARLAVHRWNDLHAEDKGVVLLPIGWVTHSYPEKGSHPQSVINKQVLERADILIALFNARLGTPTEGYDSGTVEEIQKAHADGKHTMVYFSNRDIKREQFEPDEYKRLEAYKEQFDGLYEEYSSSQDLAVKVRDALVRVVNDKLESYSPQGNGVHDFYELPEPELSDHAKRLLRTAAIKKTNILKAHHMGGLTITVGRGFALKIQDRKEMAYWEAAIGELEEEGYLEVRGIEGNLFDVTRKGYEYAEARLDDEWLLKNE